MQAIPVCPILWTCSQRPSRQRVIYGRFGQKTHASHLHTLISNVFLDVIDCPKISLFELVEAFGGHSDGQNNENTREKWAKC